MRALLPPLVALLATLMMACSGPFSSGVRAYHDGCYADAIERLREAEPQYVDTSPLQRSRYALYRGLTHLALGDRESSLRWLAEAKAWHDWNPALLPPAEQGRLLSAWRAMGRRNGELGAHELQRRGLHSEPKPETQRHQRHRAVGLAR